MSEDIRYLYSKCISCGREWQHIDFGCAAHVYYCPDYDSGRSHQQAELQKIIDDLQVRRES